MKCMEPHIATCMTENEHRSLALQKMASQPLQEEQEARGPPSDHQQRALAPPRLSPDIAPTHPGP